MGHELSLFVGTFATLLAITNPFEVRPVKDAGRQGRRHTSPGGEGGISMSELTCLELSVLLWVAHVLTQSVTARAEFGLRVFVLAARRAADAQRPRLGPGDPGPPQLCREFGPVRRHGSGADRDEACRRARRSRCNDLDCRPHPLSPDLCDGRQLCAHCALGHCGHRPPDDAGPSGVVLSYAASRPIVTRHFAAVHESPHGTSHHFVAAPNLVPIEGNADIDQAEPINVDKSRLVRRAD